MSNMPACITPSKLKMHGLKCSTPAKYYSFPLATIILKAVSYTWFPVSTQTSTQSHSGNIFITQYMLFIVPLFFFSEMASQKWIVFFAFLMLFIFMEEATIFPACKEEVIKQLKESITALENCNCSGKSTNSPVKVKQRRDEQRCFQQICIEMVFFRYKYSLHLFAKRYFSTTPLVKILDYVRHTSRRTNTSNGIPN